MQTILQKNYHRIKPRVIGLDLIRSLAIFFVIAGHFFSLNTEFKTTEFSGISMFIQLIFFIIFISGVPLFILLTGYLNRNKTVSKDYYKSCIRVLVAYLFFSIVTILFRKYYLHEDMSWIKWGLKILDFSAIPYGWYIEMWIGLFLLTPFLNMMCIHSFSIHLLLVLYPCLLLYGGFKPSWKRLRVIIPIVAVIAVIMHFVNNALSTNFFFVNGGGDGANPLSLLENYVGWWYLLAMPVIGAICWIPMYLIPNRHKSKKK